MKLRKAIKPLIWFEKRELQCIFLSFMENEGEEGEDGRKQVEQEIQ